MLRTLSIFGSLIRIAIAATLLWLCDQALPSWEAQQALAGMADYDYRAQAEDLRAQQRFGEALLVVDAGLSEARADPVQQQSLSLLRQSIVDERDDWRRRLADVGQGALTGTGESREALAGAVAADLFVFGDVRDLLIQGSRGLQGEEVDEVIVGLSAAGIALTAAPALDLGTALLKFARRVGALSEAFAKQVVRLTREAVDTRSVAPLGEVIQDSARLGQHAEPAAAIAILKNIDDAAVLKSAARLAEKPGGAFALWVGEKPALKLAGAGADGEAWLLRASRKGRAGIEFAAARLPQLARVHPLLGLIKGLYKGHLQQLLNGWLMRHAPQLVGLFAGWLLFEALLLVARLFTSSSDDGSSDPASPAAPRQAPGMTAGSSADSNPESGRREPSVG